MKKTETHLQYRKQNTVQDVYPGVVVHTIHDVMDICMQDYGKLHKMQTKH